MNEKSAKKKVVSMSVPADAAFLPLATAFVEKAGNGLGLGHSEALALTLATEELFSYLCGLASPDQEVGIRCTNGGYYIRADFDFPVEDFNMRAFNLTAQVSVEDESSLQEMGLLIAARSVDRFQVTEQPGHGVQLTLLKEKAYPGVEHEEQAPSARPLETFSVRPPETEELKLFVVLVERFYPAHLMPRAFHYPGKVVDMVGGGEYRAALAVGSRGEIGGGILWHWIGQKTVECFGPYLFDQEPGSAMGRELLEACLGSIARTPVVGLINRLPTDALPREYFEPLGSVHVYRKGEDEPVLLEASFRQMQEDPGTSVWCHTQLEPFLKDAYQRLVLPRNIRLVQDLGETKSQYSVLSADVNRSQQVVTLRPIHTGADIQENLAGHIRLFEQDARTSLFFEMDVSRAWHADFTPALFANGFSPRIVLPYAGEGDLVIFQRAKGGAA
ncbi:MAG: hypothetical protein PVG49_08280 [Desulfobacteraceae bacterium]